jgi:8-oxo-dGTP pyrophosphatase MutT (NUDIX family)
MALLKELLKSYKGKYPKEPATDKVLDFLEYSGSIDENNIDGHFTGSAWVVNTQMNYVLMTHHKKLNMWLQLGGHSDGEVDLFKVALREAKEESGLLNFTTINKEIFDLDIHIIPEQKDLKSHTHYDIRFLLKTELNQNDIKISEESHKVEWIALDKVLNYNSEKSIERMVQKTYQLKNIL